MDPNRHHEFIGGNEERQSAMYFNRGIEENRTNTQYYSQERVIVNNKSCMCPSMSSNITCNVCPSIPEGNWNQERTPRVDFQPASVIDREKVNPNSMYIHESRQYFHPNNSPAYTAEVLPNNRHIVGLQKNRNLASNKNCVLESNYNFKQQLQQQHQQQQPQYHAQSNLIQMQTQSNIANMSNLPPPPQQQQQHQQHVTGIGHYSKDIIYDEKYQTRQDLYKDVKINYDTVSVDRGALNTATMYSEVMQGQKSASSPIEVIRNTKVDPSNVINPSNSLALKEQQASPNYARKCPQIFSHNDLGNTHTTHQSLYMSTPQFSSDNFNNIHTQRKILHESELKVRGCTGDLVKVNELQMSSISGYPSNGNNNNNNHSRSSSNSKYHHQQIHDAAIQQTQIAPPHLQEPLMNNDIARNQNYYLPGTKPQIATVTEMPPIIAKQAQITSQYSNNPKALPAHTQQSVLPHQTHHHTAKSTTTHDLISFKTKEDIYEPMIHPNSSGLYVNPYKTTSPIDTCCKDVSPTPYVNMTNSFSENIGQQHNYYKYGKITKDTMGKNNICPQNQNTPPPTPVHRTAGYKTQPYIYETQHIKYDGNVHNTNFNMSPNVATVASPSPSQTTPPNHVQVQHTNLAPSTPQGRTQSQSPANYGQIRHQHHNHIEMFRPSARTHLEGAAMHSNANFCTYDRTPQNPKLLNSQTVNLQPHPLQAQPMEPQIQAKTISNLSNQSQKQQNSIKKSQVPKTNYRELINQVVALRSATSEKELDLQIIKKALNSATGSPVSGQPVEKLSQSMIVPSINNMPIPINPSASNLENGFLMENASTPPMHRNTSRICVDTNLPDIQRTIKAEEPLTASPLDLSMRTVKTKADSTEYRYHQELFKNPQIDYKHALPRVDFTPNFSLHSIERPNVPKIVINQQQNPHLYTSSPEVPSAIVVPVGSTSISLPQAQQIKQYSTEEISRVSTVTQRIGLAPMNDAKQKSLVFKSSDENVNTCQIRPSVVETNPFATVRSIKSEPNSVIDRNVPTTVDHLQPPSSNVITLHKASHTSAAELNCVPTYCGGSVIKTPDQVSLFDIEKALPNTSAGSVHSVNDQRHSNYPGYRKRHLQEYSNSQRNEPVVKQQRYQDRDVLPKTELIPMATISTSVIALNDRTLNENKEQDVKTEKSIQAEINPWCQRESSIIVNNNVPICKIESITPTMDTTTPPMTTQQVIPVVPIKTETSSVIAARIRTKAELKGFTFNTPPIDVGNTIKEPIKIKEEPIPCQTFNTDLPSIPGLDDKYDSSSLLDFSWNNKCNDFMEQLLTRSQTKKPSNRRFININTEISENRQDIRKMPATERKTSNVESDENSKSWDRVGDTIVDSTMTGERGTNKSPEGGNSSHSATINTQKKISKQDREKIRSQQERRIAARLQVESSSESEDEMHKRKSDRSKKPLKKAKARQNTPTADTKQFSDCGSDSSDTNDLRSSTKTPVQMNEEENDDNQLMHTPTKQKIISVKEKKITELMDKSTSSKKEKCQVSGTPKLSENEDGPESCSSSKKPRLKATLSGSEEKPTKQDKLTKSEQENCKSEQEIGKSAKKPKVLLKLGLNTMTRSKRKREMELQLANSKVLRNDKIIRNSTTKLMSIKRKYVRKFGNQSSVSAVCKEISKKQSDRELSMRLRSRNEKPLKGDKKEKVPGSNSKKINKTALKICKNDSPDVKSKGGKERQADMFLEVYRYKRSLKIPPSLITIDHPHNIKMAASLPDLDLEHDSNTNKNTTKFSKSSSAKVTPSTPTTSKTQQEQKSCDERRSIIDVLHSRVINTNASNNGTRPKNKKTSNIHTIPRQVHSDVSRSAESSLVTDLLSIPIKKENEDDCNDGKKRHFSIFETTVLKTKTRTESKMQQRQEIIREIFVGDDRPASAPPEIISQMSEGNDKMTFEQKYEQFLQQLNIVINDDKLRKYGKTTSTLSSHSVSGSVSASTSTANHYLKDEEDTLASNGAADADDKALEVSNSNNKIIAEADGATSSFRRRRPGKYVRRKGSSGFDYIRKKKKPNPNSSVGVNSMQNMQTLAKLERKTEDEIYERKVKTESDVCREIQKWVLNKSVGQSAMHKAARLGYIDVVVYCLDRMGMNPDQKDNAGYTPLHEACTKGWLEIARILLQYGANHSEAAHSGIRPLHEASENDHEEVVRLLLSYGADPLLATYSGQTPLMLASSTAMRDLLNNHLSDVQNVGPDRKPWHFRGPWEILDSSIYGYDIFGGAPNFTCDMSRALRKSSISNKKQLNSSHLEAGNNCKTMMENCAVVLDNIDRFNSVRLYNDNKPEILVENSDSEGEMFEFEEADILLPPLYLLKDEGTDKWVLLSDLCNLLKVKSKDTLLNKIYPPSSSASSAHKSLMRELKMSDFLERATCLQLLCAGEKINICASKVVLIKYNDSVRNLLGVKTILMKF